MSNKSDQNINAVSIVPGMFDTPSELSSLKAELQSRISNILGSNGYKIFDYPILESTELFVRKSGGEITSRLYSFIDPGGNKVSLRPEFTSSVIRAYVSDSPRHQEILRSQYVGPVFRYTDPTSRSRLRQFTQQGCEIIGSVTGDISGDSEILNLAIKAIDSTGSSKLTVKLGHVGYVKKILGRFGLNEVLIYFTLSQLTGLKTDSKMIDQVCSQALDMGMVANKKGHISVQENDTSSELIRSVLSEGMASDTGRRSRQEIIERLIRKKSQTIEIDVYRGALQELVSFLKVLDGPLSGITIDRQSPQECTESLEYFVNLIDGLEKTENMSVEYIVDFASQRGITYYTGLIFDLDITVVKDRYTVGGGGRYDGLVKILGGDSDVPAIGFALNIDTMLEAVSDIFDQKIVTFKSHE